MGLKPRVGRSLVGRFTFLRATVILFCAIASVVPASAQMYNYMGNHVILNMEGNFSPAWFNPNPVSSSWNVPDAAKRYLGVNYFLSPSVEVLVWKKGTVGAGYNFYKSPFKGTDYRVRLSDGHSGYYYGDDFIYSYTVPELTGEISAHGFNLYYKQYISSDGFAPLGHYVKVVFDGLIYRYSMPQPEGIMLAGTQTLADFEPVFNNKGAMFGLRAEYGYDLILFDRLKLSLGASLGTTFGGYKAPGAQIKDELSFSNSKPELNFDNWARGRILGAYWFGLKLGIGVIAF